MKMIRIGSHRAWDRVERAIGRTPKGLFNMKHPGSRGLCEVTREEWEKVKDIPSVTGTRVKRNELFECWSSGVKIYANAS